MNSSIRRRDFLAGSATVAATWALDSAGANWTTLPGGRFQLKYAPHFGAFRHLAGDEPAEQIRFLANQGFRAIEDVGLRYRPYSWRLEVARELDRCGIEMGAFEATADFRHATFASGRRDLQATVLREMSSALDIAEQMNARWVTVIPGKVDQRQSPRKQTANAVELMRRCAELCEQRNHVMLLEPLRRPTLFLQSHMQALQLCREVNSPSCQMLYDIGNRSVATADLLREIDTCGSEIGYFRVGDFPGRKEPGTGAIEFRAIFRHLWAKGFDGLLGMDHGNMWPGEDGEQRVIDSYVAHDNG